MFYDEQDLLEEERRRKLATGANVKGSIFSDPSMYEDPQQQGPFADIYQKMASTPRSVPATPLVESAPPKDVSAFRIPLWRFSSENRQPGDNSAFPNLFASAPPPGYDTNTNTMNKPYQHYSASAQPMSEANILAQSQSASAATQPTQGFFDQERGFFGNTFGAMDAAAKIRSAFQNYDPNIRAQQAVADAQTAAAQRPGFFRGVVDSLLNSAPGPFANMYGDMERTAAAPALMSNEAGPLGPGQRRSAWRNDNGVMINDGSEMVGAPTSFDPGAGYVRHTRDGIVPIAAPGDADWGNRLTMEPYTNPLIQAQARDQAFRQSQLDRTIAGKLAETQMMVEGRQATAQEREQMRAQSEVNRIITNPSMPTTAKMSAVDKLHGVEEPVRNAIKLDLATSKFNPTTKQRDPIPHTDPKGVGQIGALLKDIPSGIPAEEVMSFLEEQRGVSRRSLLEKISKFSDYQEEDIKPGSRMEDEYNQFVRLGLMPRIQTRKQSQDQSAKEIQAILPNGFWAP